VRFQNTFDTFTFVLFFFIFPGFSIITKMPLSPSTKERTFIHVHHQQVALKIVHLYDCLTLFHNTYLCPFAHVHTSPNWTKACRAVNRGKI
jgi:hypothetical protein